MTPAPSSMYEQAMGESFATLGQAVQRFHRLAGRHELHGRVQTIAPSGWLAKMLALGLGTPTRASEGPIRFELLAEPHGETWTRHFPASAMRSRLRRHGTEIVESLGLARLRFELRSIDGRLVMRLERLHFLGIRCPAWLAPTIVAEESGTDDRFLFTIEAAVPFVGRVAGYRGHLVVPAESFP